MDGCPRCNTPVHKDDLFCGQCGIPILAQKQSLDATLKELKLNDVQLSLGIVYFKKAEYEKAVETFKRILKMDSNHIHAKRLLKQAQKAILRRTGEVNFA